VYTRPAVGARRFQFRRHPPPVIVRLVFAPPLIVSELMTSHPRHNYELIGIPAERLHRSRWAHGVGEFNHLVRCTSMPTCAADRSGRGGCSTRLSTGAQ